MLKKTTLLGTLLISGVTTAYTAENVPMTYIKSGVFGGVQAGTSFMHGKFNSTFNDPPLQFRASGSASASKGLLALIAGYRHVFSNAFTLGADLTAAYEGSHKISTILLQPPQPAAQPFVNKLKRSFSFIPSLTLGTVFAERFHAFLGLGVAISSFRVQVLNVAGNAGVSSSATKIGFAPSLGLEYAWTHHVSLTAAAGYEIYQKMRKTFGQALAPALAGSSYVSSISPRVMTVKFGVLYRL
jgi:opacity protein-like surface antigen